MELETLKKMARVLLDSDSDILTEAEEHLNNKDLILFATLLAEAGERLADAAKFIQANKTITETHVEHLAAVAESFDESGDPEMQKTASVLDEILLTIGSNPKNQMAFKKAEQEEIDRLRAKYDNTNKDYYIKAREEHKKEIDVNEAIKSIDSKVKKYRPLEASLSTRYSPDMPGVSLMRIGESVYQCPVTKKIYDFRSGYTTSKGNVVPGSDVSNQTQHLGFRAQEHMNFSTREEALNRG